MSHKNKPKKATLGLRDIQKAISADNSNPYTFSVPTPFAQTLAQCEPVPVQDQATKQLKASVQFLKINNPPVYIIAMILLDSGCRISEVLAIRSTDVSPQGRVMIKGAKGSNDRIVFSSTVSDQLIKLRSMQGPIFAGISRFHVYRSFKSAGLGQFMSGRSRQSVTHLFRHLYAQDLQKTTHGKKAITTGLGHKNDQSADHYSTIK